MHLVASMKTDALREVPMLIRRKCLRHDVCELLEDVDFSEFDDTGIVETQRIVKKARRYT